jgi:hypothetical protein
MKQILLLLLVATITFFTAAQDAIETKVSKEKELNYNYMAFISYSNVLKISNSFQWRGGMPFQLMKRNFHILAIKFI